LLLHDKLLFVEKPSPSPALLCGDRFGSLLALGLTTWLAAQSALNIAVNLSVAPMTGVPLPFLSHGGSSLLMLALATGILFGVSREGRNS